VEVWQIIEGVNPSTFTVWSSMANDNMREKIKIGLLDIIFVGGMQYLKQCLQYLFRAFAMYYYNGTQCKLMVDRA
jgi:hypothetical protein